MAGHRHEFDRQLDAIDIKVIELFAVVCEDLPGVTQTLLSGSNAVAGQLAERDRAIDALSGIGIDSKLPAPTRTGRSGRRAASGCRTSGLPPMRRSLST